MNSLFKASVLGVALAGIAACSPSPKGAAGSTLPEGDAEQGKTLGHASIDSDCA